MAEAPQNGKCERTGAPHPRRALVTGATSGIGAATAEVLARLQWAVVLVGRDRARCESAVARTEHATGNSNLDYVLADLSTQQGVRDAAEQFLTRYNTLHVLINNVGGLFLNRRENRDGIELTLALNHLAPFLLTNLLLDVMRRSEPARIVNVSSIGHHLSEGIRRDDLQWRRRFYRGFQVYHKSKLANLLFTYELARRLEGTRVTVNAVGPRLVQTNIGTDNRWYWRMLKRALDRVFAGHFITPKEGARTVVHLATSPDVDEVTGRYFVDETEVSSSPASQDVETARWLWRMSEELSGLHP
jgi:retinol dehydrogenase-14